MRVTLLLIIAGITLWTGLLLGRVADHYQYLENLYTHGLAACDKALADCVAGKPGGSCKFR